MAMSIRTKALRIEFKTKRAVNDRDHGICVSCGAQGLPEAHFIARSQSGLGVEENVLTLCRPCHTRYDQSEHRADMREFFREYLKSKYPDWNESELTYKKEY